MRLLIAAIGRLRAGPERELVTRYLERAKTTGRQLGLSGFEFRECAESRAAGPATRNKEEAAALLALVPADARLVALDERGKAITSEAFAHHIGRWRDDGTTSLIFAIGGPDGLDPAVRERADLIVGFSALTWPHQLVRVMLTEQLYRATTILSGHPYHRGG
ncbi:MAG: 23S rRNA (pseudouridine(1915)-N(3))-methyltransferase RlmH [Cucumibacter sp.]